MLRWRPPSRLRTNLRAGETIRAGPVFASTVRCVTGATLRATCQNENVDLGSSIAELGGIGCRGKERGETFNEYRK